MDCHADYHQPRRGLTCERPAERAATLDVAGLGIRLGPIRVPPSGARALGESRPTSAATYLTYWPQQHDNPDASPLDHYIAKRYAQGIPIIVVSDTLTADDTGPWRDQTTIVRRADSHEAVARLREQDGDALIFGSQTLWTDLLAHGLVDELHLMIGPKMVAGDHRAFHGLAETDLRLIGVRTWGGSDNVVLS